MQHHSFFRNLPPVSMNVCFLQRLTQFLATTLTKEGREGKHPQGLKKLEFQLAHWTSSSQIEGFGGKRR